ncbi:hypothetical protein LL033_23865 [Clostridium estertheticum]|uniref:hypothetical protein n=1 Tax=Clostridium estertheticum TaxID=238834 RepID=UPI001C0DC5E3|nr:hypothetical protein [Clostridium estertheticum]MBU3215129.1 hypothetical protein [Clostridium estertheticum]WAG55582.1 hypothetical protein LL033_23865 [Clostridium estertheticum]
MKKLSKILSILLMVALLVTINFNAYAKSRSGGFKSSGSHSSSSSKSSSSSSSGGFKSSNSYTKPSTATTDKTSPSSDKSTSTSSNSETKTPIVGSNNNYSNNNHRSFIPMMFFGNSFGSSIFRYAGLIVILLIMFYAYRFIKRKRK